MYDSEVVRGLFEQWGHEPIQGDPGESTSRWCVPHLNHRILDRWLPDRGKALDIGCGLGIEAVRLARRGLRVVALDISRALLRHAARRTQAAGVSAAVRLVQGDVTRPLPLGSAVFDIAIAMTGVVSHTGDRHAAAIENITRSVRRGGRIIVGVDSYYGKIREYLSDGRVAEARRLADTRYTCTVSDRFMDYCFTPEELISCFAEHHCRPEAFYSAPTVGPYVYGGEAVMELEERFLGVPELLGAGGQLIGVFGKLGADAP